MQIVGHRSILESYYKLGETLNPDLKIREYDRVRSSPDVKFAQTSVLCLAVKSSPALLQLL